MALTLAQLQARLTQIDATIDAILTGGASESKLNDQQVEIWVKKLSLKELQDMREITEQQIASLSGTRRGFYAS